jgi:nicotinate (nicotinamide) nucleotide adenylyltransferase
MQFFRRANDRPSHLAVFPGAFNPITIAHLALARAALSLVDEVVFVLPREFPHKAYVGAPFAQRVQMLQKATVGLPRLSIATSTHGLFVEIAQECREVYGENVRLTFLCGRDAAERIVNWDYGRPGAFLEMLRQFELLVAARDGEYAPPAEFRNAIRPLPLSGGFDDVSASEVRDRIARGKSWEHLVPSSVHRDVAAIYAVTAPEAPPDSTPGT